MIKFTDLNTDVLADTLQAAAYDFSTEANGMVYVRSEQVPFWVEIDARAKKLILRTHWSIRPEAIELAVLRYVNRCNGFCFSVQFWSDDHFERFYGAYTLPVAEGLDPRDFLRATREFANSYSLAMRTKDFDDVLCDQANGEVDCEVIGDAEPIIN